MAQILFPFSTLNIANESANMTSGMGMSFFIMVLMRCRWSKQQQKWAMSAICGSFLALVVCLDLTPSIHNHEADHCGGGGLCQHVPEGWREFLLARRLKSFREKRSLRFDKCYKVCCHADYEVSKAYDKMDETIFCSDARIESATVILNSDSALSLDDPKEFLKRKITHRTIESSELDNSVNKLENLRTGFHAAMMGRSHKRTITVPKLSYSGLAPPPNIGDDIYKGASLLSSEIDDSVSINSEHKSGISIFSVHCNMMANNSTTLNWTVWAKALALILAACVRFYISKTGAENVTIDQVALAKRCSHLVARLHDISNRKLEAVKSDVIKYMSKRIARTEKD
ncbi:hypothetical protein CkaCkLH20_01995 [Colletotrichum karsti]|uniref:Uncharacterized protein n=1 Tax=Colletotrichum karsti TaxID=1095194 RepID=A0A9P6IDP4_9PEZI|nr:uncharacterized protein CkaCkLH20_01995 [Colletotrichum karsti]KAF9880953.1 hypothetical protein CkaCkLH20_01995 [Colletotrichum karsti]